MVLLHAMEYRYRYVIANDIAVLLTIPVGAAIYFIMMIKVGGVKSQDIKKLPMGGRLNAILYRLPLLRKELQSGSENA